ncbi:MAG: terminase, partial [Roseovarius sp.]
IDRFRRAAYDGDIQTTPNLLLRNALKNTVIVRDDANNMKTSKRRSMSRIDAACATILAVSEAQRRQELPAPKAPRYAWA